MPEGPSLVLIREALEPFEEMVIRHVEGNAKADILRMKGRKLDMVLTWGKHLLLCFEEFYCRIHLLMFGSWRINERKDTPPRLLLKFSAGEFSFYNCSIRLTEGIPLADYDWTSDVMSPMWDPNAAGAKLTALKPGALVCDAILNQEIFSGAGNIIKNEVLWRTRIHPESKVRALSMRKRLLVVKDVREYSLLFYEWKKQFVLKKNWKIYKKQMCPRCELKTMRAYIGKFPRLTWFCDNCQKLYK